MTHRPPARLLARAGCRAAARLALLALLVLAGCGVPGDPRPRRPLVPLPVADLAARQQGEAVLLRFTLPRRAADGRELRKSPDIAIYRWFHAGPQPPAPQDAPARPYLTIPGALADTYRSGGQIQFTDPLSAALLAQHAGQQLAYLVRALASEHHPSQESNVAVVRIFPVPEAPAQLTATAAEDGVELRWRAVERTTDGARLAAAPSYRIYRAESAEATPPGRPSAARQKETGSLIGVAPGTSYRDTQAEFGRHYLYWVTSVAQFEAESVESARSEPVEITPRDVFPPAPPAGLTAVFIPATAAAAAAVELSWSISREPDLAGYRVYRSEQPGEQGVQLSPERLAVPAFRDTQLLPGRSYFYRVTAVDRAGNESAASAPVSVEIPRTEDQPVTTSTAPKETQ